MPNLAHATTLFSLGVCGTLGHYLLSQSAKLAEGRIITPFEYTGFIFVAAIGYLFFNEIPSNSVVIGALLIIISGIYVAYRERKNDN